MLNNEHRRYLLDLARRSIAYGLSHHTPLPVDLANLPPELRRLAACFVTLEKDGDLRGCVGMLQAERPLAEDVADNAYAAAFADHRFAPLAADELDRLDIHISILGEPSAMAVASQQELIAQLRPGVDGLILQEGGRRATFLPSVWESLPDPRQFVERLQQKGGWPRDYWSPQFKAYRYETEQFP
ncbi:AmmeMemoRadiSam system protein A [Methylogaea oryzae]|uniref:AMMECR1 domain-containing protein n=1 Tax=Methylogaea oryzae TaxID=1295382 RepID=A0A8D5ALE8_9GAMM|nr:AmmeMemoRadiSam system protein A [Methylogaea oryzae]BBL70065.1 hypothetical protein MoryE10_06710 [Methylogaea oryzae]